MDRRQTLRILGVASLAAAVAPACAAAADPSLAWRDPGAAESDPRRRALAYALLAPNPHNMQPWMADLREPGRIRLVLDPERVLPDTDPFGRQILIGAGAFLELLRMTAAETGLSAATTLFPEGEPQPKLDRRPFASIDLTPQSTPRDPLFAQVLKRRTSRAAFTSKPLDSAAVARILAAATSPEAAVYAELAPDKVTRLRALAFQGAEIEAHTPAANGETCDRTFIGEQEVAAHRYGVSLRGPLMEVLHATGVLTQDTLRKEGSFAFDQSLAFMKGLADSAQGFLWIANKGETRADQIAAGRAYVRANLAATAEGISMHPWSQGLQEYAAMAGLYRTLHHTLTPEGGRVQMLARLGYGPTQPPAPRRGLAQQLLPG
ncbi:MAG: twin-arginine translocation pathway signal protein [Pseudomonadota bacterium]|jgi:hypothetical protein